MNTMDFTKLDSIREIEEKRKAVKKAVTKKNYNGNPDDDSTWSLFDIISQFYRSTCAQMASTHINGDNSRGKRIRQPILNEIQVKLKVLSRQACHEDSEGVALNKNPLTDEFVLYTDKPKDGDVVRVKRGNLTFNEDTEKLYSKQEIDNMRMMGIPTYDYEDYEVENGCILVNGVDAMHLLSTKGERLVVPKHKKAHSTFSKEPTKGDKRRITNWLFAEVGDEPEETPQQKAAKTRAENKAKKELEQAQENDN
jgi:hypothetical protein